jgi:cell division protein FtsL
MTRRRAAAQTRPSWQWFAVAGAIYAGIAASGVCVAAVAQDVRGLFVALAKNQTRQDELLAQYSRLLIERGTLSSYQNVDQAAERQLAMRFPETVERVSP